MPNLTNEQKIAEIERLRDLYREGAITEDEYLNHVMLAIVDEDCCGEIKH